MAEVQDQCIGSFNGNYPGLRVQQLVKEKYRAFLKVRPFAKTINKLIMGSAPGHPEMPMFMGVGNHDGTGDDVMIVKDVQGLAHQYCGQGVPVQLKVYQGAAHSEAGLQFFPEAMAFLGHASPGCPSPAGPRQGVVRQPSPSSRASERPVVPTRLCIWHRPDAAENAIILAIKMPSFS